MNLTNRAARAVWRLFEMTPTSTNKGIISNFFEALAFELTGDRSQVKKSQSSVRRKKHQLQGGTILGSWGFGAFQGLHFFPRCREASVLGSTLLQEL